MAKLERKFQKELIDEIKELYPGCVVLKNDPAYIQGFPDLTVLYEDKWAVLEVKRDAKASVRPNQERYVAQLDEMSFSRFVSPENKEEILRGLQQTFKP